MTTAHGLPARVEIGGRKTLHDGFIHLESVEIRERMADGSVHTAWREIHDHGHGVAVLPVDETRRTVLLVRQLRYPALVLGEDPFLVETCAGLREDGEDPAACTLREAEEELGYRIHDLDLVSESYMSPGSVTERLCLYLAGYSPADRVAGGGGLMAEGEHIEVLEWSCAELAAAVRERRLHDGKTVLLALALMVRRPDLFV